MRSRTTVSFSELRDPALIRTLCKSEAEREKPNKMLHVVSFGNQVLTGAVRKADEVSFEFVVVKDLADALNFDTLEPIVLRYTDGLKVKATGKKLPQPAGGGTVVY